MNEIRTIFVAEFLRKIRSRPFIIGTLIGALAIIGLSVLPGFVTNALDNATRRVIVAGDPALVDQAAQLLSADYDVVARLPRPATAPTLADLNAHQKAAAFVIVERALHRLGVTIYTRDPTNFDQLLARDLIPLNLGIATGTPLAHLLPYFTIDLKIKSLDAKFADSASASAARGVAYILVMLLYMSILLNSQNVMASVAEEKTSRIAELLVAMTSPARLLTAKILAAGSIGLIQLSIWIVIGLGTGAGILGAFGNHFAGKIHGAALASGTINVSGGVILAFIFFFLIGFMQYATLYAAAASLINRTEDLGSVAAPLVLPVIGGFFLAQYALAFPQSHNVAILSQVPLVSPFIMFTRMTISAVPFWQIAVSLVVNIAATILIIWAAGKVYRVGLLLYGRPPSLKQVFAALRA